MLPTQPMLVGRARELEAIDAALARAIRGERAAVMLAGEPGIGKTRLLDELAARTAGLGGIAAWGRSAEVGLTPALWPWMEVLSALETPDARLTLDHQPADAGSRLARFEQVVQLVRARAAQVPVVALLFDDAHAADLTSLQLLEYALPRLVGKVVVAVATRDADAAPAVRAQLGRIQRATRRVSLARLGRDDVTQLVGDRVAAPAIARIWELTEGNPLFVEELVCAIGEGDTLVLPAVSSVRAIIRDRIDQHMAPEAGATLAAAALVGREFRAAVVAEILGLADGDVVARLGSAQRLGMVVAMTGDRYKFSHALIAEALADELEPSERARLHLRAAQAIEKKDGGETATVAHHLLAAGHLAAEAAVLAAERAATTAMARLGFEDAAALLERAVAALALAGPDDRARKAHLECRWAEALQHAGEHVRAAERCDSAARLARELGDVELLARIAIVRGLEFLYGRTDPLLVSVLREAIAATAGDRHVALRARLLARLAAAEQPAADPDGPVRDALAAIELARAIPDADRLDVGHTAVAALIEYIPGDQLEPILLDNLRLATAAGNQVLVVHTLARLCFAAIDRLDRGTFEQRLLELRPRVHALGIARWLRTLHLIDAAIALLDGRLADADRAADAAEAVNGGQPGGRFLIDAHRLLSSFTRGAIVGPELCEFATSYEPGRAVFLTWLDAEQGTLDDTRRRLEHLGLPVDPQLALMLVNAVARAGTTAQREQLYARIAARRRSILFTTMVGSAVIDLYDRAALVLAASLARWDDLDRHAADAYATAEQLASPVWATRIRADHADALERRGRPGDRERARELRVRALADAERIGMPTVIARCRGVAEPAPVTAPAGSTALELTRSGELWRIAGFGEHAHLKDSRGVQMLARLLDQPNHELHVLDLSGAGGAVDGGDAGEVLDATARAAYRERLRELAATRDEAEAWGDTGRLDKAQAEIEALTEELERAVGLGNRERRQGSATERARTNIQRRLAHALGQVRAACPRIGEHLAATIRTGTYCCYEPR